MNKESHFLYIADQLDKYADNDHGRELADTIRVLCDGADTADDNRLRGDLPAGVGERMSSRWFARAAGGESCEQISQDTYNSADTVEETVRLVAAYIEQEATGIDQ